MRKGGDALLLCGLVIASLPVFFETYRTFLFGTTPIDDYRPYLLHLVGHADGRIPGSPFAYRIGSIAVAVPFYFLPPTHLSLASQLSESMLRASQALSLVAWLSTLATSVLFFAFARKTAAGRASELCAALAPLVTCRFLRMPGVDAFAVLFLATVVFAEEVRHSALVVALLLLSVVCNEKVALAAVLYFGFLALRQRRYRAPATAALTTCLVYLAMRLVWRVPGNEGQTQPTALLAGIIQSWANLFSGRGLVLNLFPVLLLLLALRFGPSTDRTWAAFVAVIGMALIGASAQVVFNIGCVAMHCYPFVFAALIANPDAVQAFGERAGAPASAGIGNGAV